MTFYNLPGVKAKLDYDQKTRVLTITGLEWLDRVITTQNQVEQNQSVRIQFV
jgi:hypothetical protein